MNTKPLIAYYRVSTRQQMRSGLGLHAQKLGVANYVRGSAGVLHAEYTEIESGRENSRPQLREALRDCRVYRATLVIARLDRLARSVSMISAIMKSGVEFVAADMPLANRFTVHILAAVAEYEARLISERTKAAFAAAKAQGRKFGPPDLKACRVSPAARKASVRARRERCKALALDFLPLICELRDRGETVHGIACQLSAMKIVTPGRVKNWNAGMVSRMFAYTGERKPKPRVSRRTARVRSELHKDLPILR